MPRKIKEILKWIFIVFVAVFILKNFLTLFIFAIIILILFNIKGN